MERSAPIVDLVGTRFLVDVFKEELREITHLDNVTPFYMMEDKGTHYEFNYDPKTRKSTLYFGERPADLQRVRIDQLCSLDPEGMGLKYGIPPESLAGRADISLKVDEKDLAGRLAGKLPVITLNGYVFEVHYEGRKLVGMRDRSEIDLEKLTRDIHGGQHLLYYHSLSGTAVPYYGIGKPDAEIYPLALPNLMALDPVAASREHFGNPYELLSVYPPHQWMEAEPQSFAEMNQKLTEAARACPLEPEDQQSAADQTQIILLGRTPYEILERPHRLQEFGHPERAIEFKDLPEHEGSFKFSYHPKTSSVVGGPDQVREGNERICIPFSVAYLTEQADPRQLQELNARSQEGLWGIYLADDYIRGYLKGRPIEFEFEGTTFSLDTQNLLLVENDNPQNKIHIDQVPSSPHGYFMDYNNVTKNLARPGDDPKDISLITLDQMVSYDPLGMAKKYNISVGRLPKRDNDLNDEKILKAARSYSGEYINEQHQIRKPKKGKSL
ncbi:MAG: hypothetical protein V4594_19955 [Bacteroidota bacterium]